MGAYIMYFPTDSLFIETKKLLEGAVPPEWLLPLAIGIKDAYGARVISGRFIMKNAGKLPALELVTETSSDLITLHGNTDSIYKKEVNIAAATLFLQSAKENKPKELSKSVKPEQFHLSWYSFARVALVEMLARLAQAEIEMMEKEWSDLGVWKIKAVHGSITVFAITERKKNELIEERAILFKERISAYLNTFDRYEILNKEDFPLFFDSRERFEKEFESNWERYYR